MESPNHTVAFSDDGLAQVTPEYLAGIKRRINEASNQPPIDIILLTYNRCSYFQKTVAALIHHTRYPYRLIVVDNNSSPEMRSYLQETAGLYDQLILNEENYHTVAFQRGIACTKSDPYIVSDPDILVPALDGPCWLERLVRLHQAYPEMGLIALNLDPANKPAKLPDVYIGEKTSYGEEITLCNVGTVMQSIKRRYFDGCYLTDWETCEQIRGNGGKVGFANKIVAWHLGWDEDKDYPEYLVEKYGYFKQKYGAETYRMYTENKELLSMMNNSSSENGYYACSRPDVQLLVNPASRRILDIGCAAGILGCELKQKLSAEVWGVEHDAAIAEQARGRLDQVFAGAIEDVLPQLPDGYFDTIIMADVLEHMVEPEKVLRSLQSKLSEHGEIVASIPNVRHWSVVKQLLEGRWEYTDAGILDRTHLRFFTCMECLRLFKTAGYIVKRSEAIQLKDDETMPAGVVEALTKAGLRVATLAEESSHYQYLFVASPTKALVKGRNPAETSAAASDLKGSISKQPALTSIIILTWNQLAFTQACFASIAEHTEEPYELIVVDNGSTDGTVAWLREQAARDGRISVIENSENKGFAAGCNQGINAAKGDYVLLLNNDTVVTCGWLIGMREVLDRYPDAGIVGPMTNSASGVQVVPDVGYATPESLCSWASEFRERHRYRVIHQRRIVGFCMLFRRELIEKTGLLDETFGPGNYEDDDFCLRAELAGFRNLITGDVFIHHEGGATFAANQLARGSQNLKNRVKFKQKWEPAKLEESVLRRWLVLNAIEESEIKAQQGDLNGAIDILLNHGIKIAPNTPTPYFKLAELLIASELYDDALQVFPEMPADVDRSSLKALETICHAGLGHDGEAFTAAKYAVRGDAGKSSALVVLGMLAARGGDLKQAESRFRSAIEHDPACDGAWLSLGMLLWGNGDQEAAWNAISRAFAINPINSRTQDIYRELVLRLGKETEANQILAEASAVWPNSISLSRMRAGMLADMGFINESLAVCERHLSRFKVDEDILQLAMDLRKGFEKNGGDLPSVSTGVSLCMIVRDEEMHLGRCLASVKPVVDEMVIVDTGSADRSVDIAVAFGAKVYSFVWADDFSAARNFALSKAAGQVILVMDADEVLAERDYDAIRKASRQSADKPVAWSVTTHNYTSRVESEGWQANDGSYAAVEQGDGWYPSRKVRLFPNAASIRFLGDIHEMVEPDLRKQGIRIEQAPFVVHHYGELAESDRRAKQMRYYQMGMAKLAEHPDDTIAMVEVAIQAGELGLFDEALELWDRLLERGVSTRDVHFNRGYALMGLGRYEQAAESSGEALKLDPEHKESAYNMAVCLLNLGRAVEAQQVALNAFAVHSDYPLLKALMCVLYLCNGEKIAAGELRNELMLQNYAIDPYIRERMTVLEQAGQHNVSQKLCQMASVLDMNTT